MKERIIDRPHSFTVEEWEKLSREDQINWWRTQSQKSDDRSPHPLRFVQLYEEGTITKNEMLNAVFERLIAENVREFLNGCSTEVLRNLRQEVAKLVAEFPEEGWGDLMRTQGCVYAPWVTKEEIRRHEEERNRRYFEGIKNFRIHDNE